MKAELRQKAKNLRKEGYSLSEIVSILGISKSTASIWVRNIELSDTAEQRLLTQISKGQLAAQKQKRSQTKQKEIDANKKASDVISQIGPSESFDKILCALMYYCEGEKSVSKGVSFTNSDPLVISSFISLLRRTFPIIETKLRICVHLHSYHDKDTQLDFWSKVTKVPLEQFIKPYLKPHSGIYKKEGYQGCINIRYGDAVIGRELKALAVEYMKLKTQPAIPSNFYALKESQLIS